MDSGSLHAETLRDADKSLYVGGSHGVFRRVYSGVAAESMDPGQTVGALARRAGAPPLEATAVDLIVPGDEVTLVERLYPDHKYFWRLTFLFENSEHYSRPTGREWGLYALRQSPAMREETTMAVQLEPHQGLTLLAAELSGAAADVATQALKTCVALPHGPNYIFAAVGASPTAILYNDRRLSAETRALAEGRAPTLAGGLKALARKALELAPPAAHYLIRGSELYDCPPSWPVADARRLAGLVA